MLDDECDSMLKPEAESAGRYWLSFLSYRDGSKLPQTLSQTFLKLAMRGTVRVDEYLDLTHGISNRNENYHKCYLKCKGKVCLF